MSITLTTADEHLIVSAVRYAQGRGTYIVAMTARWLLEHWEELSRTTRGLIARDLAQDIRLRRMDTEEGREDARCSQPDWERLLDFIEAQPVGTPEHDGLKAGGAQW